MPVTCLAPGTVFMAHIETGQWRWNRRAEQIYFQGLCIVNMEYHITLLCKSLSKTLLMSDMDTHTHTLGGDLRYRQTYQGRTNTSYKINKKNSLKFVCVAFLFTKYLLAPIMEMNGCHPTLASLIRGNRYSQ